MRKSLRQMGPYAVFTLVLISLLTDRYLMKSAPALSCPSVVQRPVDASLLLSQTKPQLSSPAVSHIADRAFMYYNMTVKLKESGSFFQETCRKGLGVRGGHQPPKIAGNPCEPWMTRDAVNVLSHILEPWMEGLEWSSGSSSPYFLLRLKSLVTVEHELGWLSRVREFIKATYPEHVHKWTSYHIESSKTGDEKNIGVFGNYYDKYVSLEYTEDAGKVYDVVSIDGRSRAGCLAHVLEKKLLRADGGILILDNGVRPRYDWAVKLVPKHWVFIDTNVEHLREEGTHIWISRDGY